MSLALATLIYEWRRYLAAIIALAFSGMMVLAFSGMFAGIIHAELATWERSRADLVILSPNVKAIVNNGGGNGLPARIKPLIYLNPEVVDVEPISGDGAQWINTPGPGQKRVQMWVQMFGVEPYPGSVTLPRDFTEAERIGLMEPGAVAVDASALKQLGVSPGDEISLNHHSAHLRVILHGYQSPEQPLVVASYATMRLFGLQGDGLMTGPLMVSLKDPKRATIVRDQLNAVAHGAYHAMTLQELNQANEAAIMGEQIIGLLLGFSVFLAALIGIGVTSQTLRGAILSNIREFASLRALGIGMISLRRIVMELSFWVGIAGLFAALLLTGVIAAAAASIGLPLVIRPPITVFVCAMMMVIAIISGAMAMGILKKSQPADLLR
jgi:putative ABC transport system permease protein